MRHRIIALARHRREINRVIRGLSLTSLAGIVVIALSLSMPADAAQSHRDRHAHATAKKSKVAKKASARAQAARTQARPSVSPPRLFKITRTGKSGAAAAAAVATIATADDLAPHVESYVGEPEAAPHASGSRHTSGKGYASGEPGVASRTVLVYDETSGKQLYSRDDGQSQPIASITKLMTAMVVLDAKLPMDEKLTITWDDVDHLRGSSSRVPVGAELSREELLRLALMSSENRAAAALGRNYPGGLSGFVRAMNTKAASLGMSQSRFEDSTGLHGGNRASAMDLVRMVQAARQYPEIRDFTTTGSHLAELGRKHVEFRNTNALVRSPEWDIGLSKTGYIREAGRCLVMHARIAARPVVIVLLDGDGKYTRLGDANRIKKWLEARSKGDLLASNF